MLQVGDIPALGFGTFRRTGRTGQAAMEYALEVGYRHLDTAQNYHTESECGRALVASGLGREDVFLTTKVSTENLGFGSLVPSLRKSVETIGVDQVDLTLIHWPSPENNIPLPVYLEQIATARELGLTRKIGVSNFTIALLREARGILGDRLIATNQVELHVYLQNRGLAEFCREEGIAVTCYHPLAGGRVQDDRTLIEFAGRRNATPSQVALAFLLSEGYIAIPTSGNRARIKENFGALGIELEEGELQEIVRMDIKKRFVDPKWAPDWD